MKLDKLNNTEGNAGNEAQARAASARSVDTRTPARWGMWALMAGLAVFLLWAFFAPLSEGVPVHGYVKVEDSRKTLQNLRGGIVDAILVREGDVVKAGQPLVRLNETQFKAQLGAVESQLVSMLAVEARLMAERDRKSAIEFPAFLRKRKSSPQYEEVMQVQRQLFATRLSALKGEESIARETITGLEAQIKGLKAQEQSKTRQLGLFNEELASLRPLHEQGFIPRNRMFELERAIAYMEGQRGEDLANIGRAQSQISELKLKILQSRTQYQKEVETQLTDVQHQAADLRERYVATEDDLKRVVMRSPVAGTVVGLNIHTVGGVVEPGQKLMDVVPADAALQVEVQIPPHLIDNVHVGLEADIHFLALDMTITPTIQGKLIYVSADRLTDPKTDAPYYLGRVEVMPEGLEKLGKHGLQAGMPADVVIKTGERTMAGYLLKPLLARLQFAFTER